MRPSRPSSPPPPRCAACAAGSPPSALRTTSPPRNRRVEEYQMTTTMNPGRNRTEARPAARPRVRGSAHADDAPESREAQYDLLTAALLGVAIGAGTTL